MKRRAFSLIEVTVAIALAAVLITAVLAILPQGMQAARNAEIRTLAGMILEDVRDRLEGQSLEEGVPPISPLFYDESGRIVESDAAEDRHAERFYRVDLQIVKPAGEQLPTNAGGLMAAMVELGWPVDEASAEGELLGERPSTLTQTFLVTTLTGPDWEEIDANYEPKIEF
tara:strand:+ start:14677 stop:15189 length:513 start_codon:yes stop_codon:yes gene_type:complete